MSSVCADQHQFHPSHQLFSLKTAIRDIDIPPRKLLLRRPDLETPDMFAYSPKSLAADETLLQKFLPYNDAADTTDADLDPYASDHFRMFEFKVRRCTRSRSHDWTDCPFAHPGEKARRRDPRSYHYSGTVCPDFRRGGCSRGEECEFAHGVFECWLHPERYRTEACKDGKNCKRKVCFFAHSARELRVLPSHSHNSMSGGGNSGNHYCCLFCRSVNNSSPTSTLMGVSHFSPPLSPICRSNSSDVNQFRGGMLSYKDVVTELMSSLESISLNDASPACTKNLSWVDEQHFILSPGSTQNPSGPKKSLFSDDKINDVNGLGCPDLGWVNDLLM